MDREIKSFGQIMGLFKYVLLIGAGSLAIYLGIYAVRCYKIDNSPGMSPYELNESFKEGQYVKFKNIKLDWDKKWIYSESGEKRYYFVPFSGQDKTKCIFRGHYKDVEKFINKEMSFEETMSGYVTYLNKIPTQQYDLVLKQDLALGDLCFVFEPRTPTGLGGAVFAIVGGSLMFLFVLISIMINLTKGRKNVNKT